ncbi:MAG: V-type ATP synthase subunit A [Patescibacteria group bacterium]|nr:V-type ATP synthase subunit A [Patescibacteria group bacterium]
MLKEKTQGKIIKVAGPLVVAEGMFGVKMYEVVKVSEHKLIGEVIELDGDKASIQVYENTSGIGPGEPVYLTGHPLSVVLGPGLLTSIYDGIQRPLDKLEEKTGAYITRGVEVPALDEKKKWEFKPLVKKGDKVEAGDVLGEVQETELIIHKIMVPLHIQNGTIETIQSGSFTLKDAIAKIDGQDITMTQIWPIREARKIKEKLIPTEPLLTGQRIIDTFFPIAKGGAGCIPGPFGSGKTVVQHQLAKWADADIIIFIGCGERGNEMTDVLQEFPELKDPKSGKALMERTVLIANTSNMPVAAREASIYTGITIAEYYRDMGYNVALMGDSTSRWAEALREISGRLEEMPGEEGYPAYLASRTAEFYERAGKIKCLGAGDREGSLTVVGAVSPPGGDLSEPVTQNTLRVTKVFWALDDQLAYRRHFPAINWLNSYSLYTDNLSEYMASHAGQDWPELRIQAMTILQEESALEEVVRLVGVESLSFQEQLTLDTAKSIREDFLLQNAFDEIDTYSSIKKQYLILKAIMVFYKLAKEKIQSGFKLKDLLDLPVKEEIGRAKSIPMDEIDKLEQLIQQIENQINSLNK